MDNQATTIGNIGLTKEDHDCMDMIGADETINEYLFDIQADKKIYRTAFLIAHNTVQSTCTCNEFSNKSNCWHIQYILAGKYHRLVKSSHHKQHEFLRKVARTPGGKQLISDARTSLIRKESCRRCGSANVVILRKSLLGKLISVFKPDGHSFFCKSCKWSW